MNAHNEKESIYERFLNRISKDKPEDPPIIVGGELILVSIALLWKFYFDSSWSYILKYERYFLFLIINIGLFIILLTGLILLIYGFVIKFKNRR